jgi:ATP-binding protein involved in chromosome partitioning
VSRGLLQLAGEGAPEGRPSITYGSTAHPNNRAPFAKSVVALTSGKGGVGKSTVAVNLASAFAQMDLKVGILDCDVYGPSVPRLLGVDEERVSWGDDDKMIPAENFGIRIMSVGLTTPESDTPLGWRSSVATSALIQLLADVAWGELDVLIVDMPPGTGDVQLTMAQELHIASTVIVTTPQAVATDDVRRSIRMYKDAGVPIGGVVENMSGFRAPDTGAMYYPFGQGGGRMLADDYDIPFLGELRIDEDVRRCCDVGQPIAATGTPEQREPFLQLARALIDEGAVPSPPKETP